MRTKRPPLTTNRSVELAKPGRSSTAGTSGLYLYVSPDGKTRRWIFRYSRPNGGGVTETGLGLYPVVKIDAARGKVLELRRLLFENKDPVEEKRQKQKSGTKFRQVAQEWLELRRTNDGWSESHCDNAKNLLFVHGEPLCDKPVSTIDEPMVRAALEPGMRTHRDQAHRTRRMWKQVFDLAKFQKLRSGDNPAEWHGNLKFTLPKLKASGKHHSTMMYEKIPVFYPRLCAVEGIVAKALRFAVLTACRTQEVRLAQREEFDLDDPKGPIWTVPRERTKKKIRDHIVPLSDQAVALVRPLLKITASAGSNYLFTYDTGVVNATPGEVIGGRVMYNLLRRMDPVATVHGYRASFKTWCREETEFAREMVEICLSHQVGDATEDAYWRGTAQKRRRPIMQAWADHCTKPALTLVSAAG